MGTHWNYTFARPECLPNRAIKPAVSPYDRARTKLTQVSAAKEIWNFKCALWYVHFVSEPNDSFERGTALFAALDDAAWYMTHGCIPCAERKLRLARQLGATHEECQAIREMTTER
jgi:hypothetical protein